MKALRIPSRAALALAVAVASSFALAQPAERSGEEIVKMQCTKCHATGVNGAPRIDDRSAWAPRMKNGLDATVRSAIRGHGSMPARGGMADLTDSELRSAIVYLFNPAGSPKAPAPAPALAPNQKVVDGMDVFLGVVPKEADLYHVNITLRDSRTHAVIDNAQVEVKVADPVMGDESKKLARSAEGNVASYGNDFRIVGNQSHTITVHIRHPERRGAIETKFEFKR